MARAGVRVLAALGPAVLLAADPWGWYPFGPIKWLVVLTLTLAGSALVLQDRSPRVPRPLALALTGFLGWLVLAAGLGDDPLYAWTGTPERHLGVLTWALCGLLLVVGTALDEPSARTVVRGLVVAGVGVGAIAAAEALGWEPSVLDVADRLSGPLGSPAYLGAATALLLPVAMGVALDDLVGAGAARCDPTNPAFLCSQLPPDGRSHHKKVGWGRPLAARVAVGLLWVACLGSGARAAWVGLAAAAAVALAASAGSVRARVRARPRRAAGIAVAVLVAGALLVVLTPVGGRIADAADPDSPGGAGRLDEWRVAANVVVDHPVVGVGPEGYRGAFHEGVDATYEREHGRRQQPDRAHSGPLDLALAGGLPLLALWLAIAAIVARSIWRALRAGPAWQRGIAAGLIAHEVGQLLLFPIVELEPVAWLLAGVLVAGAPYPTPSGPDPSGASRTRSGQNSWGGVGAGLGALAVVGLVAGITDVVADHRAERAVAASARGDHRAAAVAADSAADLRPDIVRLHLLAAQAALAAEQGALAGLERVDDALAVSPRDPIALLQRLTLLVQRAESTQTERHLAEARTALDDRLDVDPYAAALWRLDARLAVVEGDPAGVARAEARAEALTPPEERR